jgi:hypothetical protein
LRKIATFFFVWLLAAAGVSAETEKLTPQDWLRITSQRKQYYVFGMREKFQEKGVTFRHTTSEYIAWLDEVAQGAKDKAQDLDNVFSELVRKKEI